MVSLHRGFSGRRRLDTGSTAKLSTSERGAQRLLRGRLGPPAWAPAGRGQASESHGAYRVARIRREDGRNVAREQLARKPQLLQLSE